MFGPANAICTGVQASSILELLTASTAPTTSIATGKSSGLSPHSFIQALFAASDTSSDDSVIADQQQKSSPAAPEAPTSKSTTVSPTDPRQIAQPLIVEPQSAASRTPALASIELPKDYAVASASSVKTAPVQQKREASTTKVPTAESNTSQAIVTSPDMVTSSLLASLAVPTVVPQATGPIPTNNSSQAVTTTVRDPITNVASHSASATFSSTVQYHIAHSADTIPSERSSSTQNMATSATTLEPHPSQSTAPVVNSNTTTVASASLPLATTQDTATSKTPEAAQNTSTVSPPLKESTSRPSAQTSKTVATPDVTRTTIPNSPPNAGKTASENSILQVVPAPPPTPKTQTAAPSVSAQTKQEFVHTSSPNTVDQTNALQATPTPSGSSTDLRAFDTAPAQVAALAQPTFMPDTAARSVPDTATVTTSADTTSAKAKESATSTFGDVLGLKQHAQAASDQAASQGASQEPSSSDGQPQSSNLQPQQSSASIPMSLANHATALDHSMNAVNNTPTQRGGTSAGTTNSTKTHESPAPLAADSQPPLPAINTARLIQSMGQTEMRVGMRSNEFGNISINTSATRDLISAQISLDHSELAKTLVSHVPEIQARLGGTQAADVRIDTNGQAAGQNAGSAGTLSPNAGGHANGDRQQRANPGTGNSTGGFAEPGRAVSVASISAPESMLDSRLDITA
jgi:hypothetical protein